MSEEGTVERGGMVVLRLWWIVEEPVMVEEQDAGITIEEIVEEAIVRDLGKAKEFKEDGNQ